MIYKEQIDIRVNDVVLGMLTNLNYAILKADKKPSKEVAEIITSLSTGIAKLLPFITDDTDKGGPV